MVGLGELKLEDGTQYLGMTQNNIIQGKGRMIHKNGDVYQGNFENGQANGLGCVAYAEGSVYKGDWKNDKPHGKGVETWADKGSMRYEGDFLEGNKTGKGKFEFEDSFYDGDFVDGQFHGEGKYFFADSGKIFKGTFVHNQIKGNGIMIFPDGSRYEGQFQDGKIEGHGTLYYVNGDRYAGHFVDDQKDGVGVWHDMATQTKRQGRWQNDKRVAWLGESTYAHLTTLNDESKDFFTTEQQPRKSTYTGRNSLFQKQMKEKISYKIQSALAYRKSVAQAKDKE